jgi:serine/threonine-protein kinase
MIRRFDSLDAQPLFPRSGDVQPRSPFVSADSTWVGFISDGSIMKAPVTGGSPVSVCECDAESRGGAAWLADGTIVYNGGAGLKAVSADGRDNRPLTKLDVEHGESEHLAPAALPGRDEVLFTAFVEPGNRSAIHAVNVTSGARRPVLSGAVSPRYFASGFLAYLDASSLLHAIRFDAARSQTSGEPLSIGTLPIAGAAAYGGYDVSATGTLVYLPGQQNAASRRLVWISRDGKEQDTNLPRHAYLYPRFSADGESVALDVRDAFSGDLWLWDLKRDTLSRFTTGAGRNAYPAWTPDGRNLLFASSRTGSDNIYRQAADGSGAAQALTNHPNPVLPYLVSPDGTMAVLRELMGGNPDLALLRLTGTPTIERLIYSRASDVNADLSPDGHWIVYQSDQSGVPEIYVQPFPDVGRGRWQISNGGGLTPLWARKGREIFFVDPGNNLMRVEVQTGASFSAGKPTRFFAQGYSNAAWTRGQGGRTFDLTPDGQRFLVVEDAPDEDSRRDNRMNVVLNWPAQLERIGPTH